MLTAKYTPEFQAVLDMCETIGYSAGAGASAPGALCLHIATQVRDGNVKNIDVVKGVPNDLKPMWDAYCRGEAVRKPAEKRSAGAAKTKMSELQAIANAAKSQKDFAGDTMTEVVEVRKAMLAADLDTESLFNSFVKVAKAAVKAGRILTEDEIQAECTKKAAAETTFQSIIEAMQGKLEKMIEGKGIISCPKKHLDGVSSVIALFGVMLEPELSEVEQAMKDAAMKAQREWLAAQLAAEQDQNVMIFETATAIAEEKIAA